MRDQAIDSLLAALQPSAGETLLVADENTLAIMTAIPRSDTLKIISNRYDVVSAAQTLGHDAYFSDFDFSAFPANSIGRILFRISKEKPVTHHVINAAWSLLSAGGTLLLSGLKNEGTKTYIEKCKQLFGNGSLEKSGLVYTGRFCKETRQPCAPPLDDRHYREWRLIQAPELDFFSKPGLFGWDKIDEGSRFLIEHLPACLQQHCPAPRTLLDLGCGYGYLTLMTRQLPLIRRVATDNNAAALQAMQINARHYDMDVAIFATDAGATLQETFDLVLCNPPFHQGFSVDGTLTDKFLQQTHRLLQPQGCAIFVVNAFIGLEQKAAGYFSQVIPLGNNRSFKVLLLQR